MEAAFHAAKVTGQEMPFAKSLVMYSNLDLSGYSGSVFEKLSSKRDHLEDFSKYLYLDWKRKTSKRYG